MSRRDLVSIPETLVVENGDTISLLKIAKFGHFVVDTDLDTSPTMTALDAPSPNVVADESAGANAWYAFSRTSDTFAGGADPAVTPQWVSLDHGASATATYNKAVITAAAEAAENDRSFPKDFKIQASNDAFTTTVDLLSVTAGGDPGNGLTLTVSWDNSTAYRYYRLYITDKYGATGDVKVQDIKFYCDADLTLPTPVRDAKGLELWVSNDGASSNDVDVWCSNGFLQNMDKVTVGDKDTCMFMCVQDSSGSYVWISPDATPATTDMT